VGLFHARFDLVDDHSLFRNQVRNEARSSALRSIAWVNVQTASAIRFPWSQTQYLLHAQAKRELREKHEAEGHCQVDGEAAVE
jgi:hypothetical protein